MPTAILCDAQTPTAAPVYLPPELGGPDLDLLARGGLIENRAAAAAAAAAAASSSAPPEPDPPPDRQPSPLPPPKHKQQSQSPSRQHKPPPLEATFIKPLPHTVIVPCASDDFSAPTTTTTTTARRKTTNTLKVGGDGASGGRLLNGPPLISRSTSEKVPHRSELMSQVQRTAWARHTTK